MFPIQISHLLYEHIMEPDYLHFICNTITATNVWIYSSIILFTVCFYWMFFVPFNWTKHLDEVNFGQDTKKNNYSNKENKRHAICRLRRARKIKSKELPPPFPNDAYCPHLGANLGIGGRVVGDNIVCPFHQWSFRGTDGACINVPYSSCVPQTSKVKKWISKEVNEYIFVWYHAEPTENTWDLPISMEIQSDQYVYHGRNEFYISCHIQEIPENGADLAHFSAIHNESIFAGSSNPKKSIFSTVGYHHWSASWSPCKGAYRHFAVITLNHSLEITKKWHLFHMKVVAKQIGPSYVQLNMCSPTLGSFQILQTITPVEPLLQKVVHRFYGPRWLAPIMKIFIFGESIMFERDINIWNHKTFRSNPLLVKEDTSLKRFRIWYGQFYTANSKTFCESQKHNW
ncbi:cholesterol 7-desaturase isoform X2 [Scaptodrosophila lebanonensis]|uniref:cholesterol 7-desaturase n=1 Tax=Drosophila lebanonensis TaxID=7225 RepID=A0A6J2TWJ6_DROLE|nr:cholesterol 7-desaturase isoform X2 [Scaptodrosophila lebanonensis]